MARQVLVEGLDMVNLILGQNLLILGVKVLEVFLLIIRQIALLVLLLLAKLGHEGDKLSEGCIVVEVVHDTFAAQRMVELKLPNRVVLELREVLLHAFHHWVSCSLIMIGLKYFGGLLLSIFLTELRT